MTVIGIAGPIFIPVGGEWHEHNYGVIRGREAIRAKITELMSPVPMMEFPVEWVLIEGDVAAGSSMSRWQVFPDPGRGCGVPVRAA